MANDLSRAKYHKGDKGYLGRQVLLIFSFLFRGDRTKASSLNFEFFELRDAHLLKK